MNSELATLRALEQNKEFARTFTQKASSWGLCALKDSKRVTEHRIVRSSLIPRLFSNTLYSSVVNVNPLFNQLIDRITLDPVWLIEAHHDVISCDKFTANLISVAKAVYVGTGAKSPSADVRLHLLRNDFMPTDGDTRILQVEINTISASFAGLLETLSRIHRSNQFQFFPQRAGSQPPNLPCTGFAEGITLAVSEHCARWSRSSSAVLLVFEEGEKNIVDQYALEGRLADRSIPVIRRTLGELSLCAKVSQEGFLFVDGIEIALVYFRSGYDPKHYPSQTEWDMRELLEKSNSVKCPSVLGQLAGTKKVQQLWCTENGAILTKFGFSESERLSLLSFFATQVDPSSDDATCEKAMINPDGWVLKPQREGGGHNIYGQELREALRSMSKTELSQYVLMERMVPNAAPTLVVDGEKSNDAGNVVPSLIEESVSELGIYSYYIPHLDANRVVGHLLRTKEKNVREGGVNAGFAVLDTIALV